MYTTLLYIALIVTGLALLACPLAAIIVEDGSKYFCILWILLYVNQMFMYQVGADVSPYAYVTAQISAIRFFGLTLSAISSIAMAAFMLIEVCVKNRRVYGKSASALALAFIPTTIGLLVSGSLTSTLDSYLKLMITPITCTYLVGAINEKNVRLYYSTITVINIIVVAQVFVCKILTGSFAAYNYYYEISEEYFGFFNHPHVFCGLLAFLCIWNIYSVSIRKRTLLNLILFICSVVLMFLSGVRTYPIALAFGIGYLILVSIINPKYKSFRIFAISFILICLIAMPAIAQKFGSMRVVNDYSSGRLDRWFADLGYFFSDYTPIQMLFGRGIGGSEDVNFTLFAVRINSLNLWIDLLLDYGIVGMILMTISYIKLFQATWNSSAKRFQTAIVVAFLVTCFINSAVSYVVIMTMILVILFVMGKKGAELNESTSLTSSAVSRGGRKQRMVGTGIHRMD